MSEGIVFSGKEGMLPATSRLEKAVKGLTKANVRRAYETAKNRRVPKGIIGDLGLKQVERVHHVSLDFDTLGADAYLAAARWIKEGGKAIEPPVPVEPRFSVELVTADGEKDFVVHGLLRTAEVASDVPSSMIALTLALYVTVYLALIVAYVAVIKHMAEKPDAAPEPGGAPVLPPRRTAGQGAA